MKAQFPLSTKIFLLAFLNLALLAVVLLVFARLQFHLEFGSFLAGPAEERVLSAARLLALDLSETPEQRRPELMRLFAATYKVDVYVFEDNGTEVAGAAVQLPTPVLEVLTRRPPGERPPPRREGGPPPRREDGAPPPPRDGRRADGRPPPRRDGGPHPFFQVETSGPKLYWVGARIPLRLAGDDDTVPGTVLMAAPSFFGTPLFFDYKPWLVVTGAMIAVFVLCWLPLIRGLTRSISQITRVTGQIAEGQFEERLPEARRDELGRLAAAINRMAARLSGFVNGQKRFLGDIAHELCSPIARIQFALGILEQHTEEGHREHVEDLREEVRQMSSLVSELLQFSKAGIQREERLLVAVDVGAIVRQAVEREGGGEARIEVAAEEGLRAMADPDSLVRAVANLVRNAIRYAGDAGPITVTARKEGDEVAIVVEDCGPGLPPDELERVFTPFYRVDASRNRALGGVGLGLAIVKSCVEVCQGKVQCRNRVLGGLAVEIWLKTGNKIAGGTVG